MAKLAPEVYQYYFKQFKIADPRVKKPEEWTLEQRKYAEQLVEEIVSKQGLPKFHGVTLNLGLEPTPALEQARLSFGTPEEQATIFNPRGLDVGDLARQVGKIPNYVGFLIGSAAGAMASGATAGLGLVGASAIAGAGATAGEIGRREIGKVLGVQQGVSQGQIFTKGLTKEYLIGALSYWVGTKLSAFFARKMKEAAVSSVDTALNAPTETIAKDVRALDVGRQTTGEKYLQEGKFYLSQRSARHDLANKILPDLGNKYNLFKASEVGKRTIDISPIEDDVISVITRLKDLLGLSDTDLQTLKSVEGLNKIDWKDALDLKQGIYDLLPRSAWKYDPKLTGPNKALRRIASYLDDSLEKAAEDMVVDSSGNLVKLGKKMGGDVVSFKQLDNLYSIFKPIYEQLIVKASSKTSGFFVPVIPGRESLLQKGLSGVSFPVELGAGFALNKASQFLGSQAGRLSSAVSAKMLSDKILGDLSDRELIQ